ncbi:amino acid ABC transporter substrate-binding protein [Rhodopila sp.]|jgi:general L-amino acid transport system substrate-binding protein|uniref:amino acid ABC transporter substrate-binding protein n=1 Tax=Rhodopila sp. TaxID=2480087 RepID=UPI002C811CED|nr:amino acid ABC transporter substrate-binding protein [Rhodopila sp.]HVZ09830.1 amino acid ABC transporter substrate-binding protein [Rhodopila sp.]
MLKRLLLLAPLLAWAGLAQAGTLDNVKQKGYVTCGVNVGLGGFSMPDSHGVWRGLDVDACRAVAAAVFGDANKVKYVPLTSVSRFTALQSGEVDILSRNTTFTFLRDATIGLRMVMVNFYDGQGFLVRKDAKIKHLEDMADGTICMLQGSTHEMNLADWMKQHNISFHVVLLDTTDVLIKALLSGRCDAASSDGSNLASIRGAGLPNPDDYVILPDRISKEPLGPMVRRGDDQWEDVVRWSMMAMVEAEELGITSANVDQMLAESQNPTVQRLLGKSGDFGKLIGLDNAWTYNVIKQVGNYGEAFERNVGMGSSLKLERGENALWTKGGMMYAIPFR